MTNCRSPRYYPISTKTHFSKIPANLLTVSATAAKQITILFGRHAVFKIDSSGYKERITCKHQFLSIKIETVFNFYENKENQNSIEGKPVDYFQKRF